MKYYLPFNLDLHEHVRKNPYTGIDNFSIDKLAYFLHLVNAIPANNKKLEYLRGFVPMNAELMKNVVYDYRKYLDYAIDTGIMLEDRNYIVDQKSRGFKFVKKYCTRVIPFVATDKRFTHSLLLKRENDIDVPRDLNFLTKPFLDGGLEFDMEGAMELLDRRAKYFKRHPDEIPKRKKKKWSSKILSRNEDVEDEVFYYEGYEEDRHKNPIELYNCAMMNFQRLADHDYHLKVDKTVGRFHSNITNMPSEWRNFLTYEGEQLVNIDIRNSQPFISVKLFDPDFYFSENFAQGSQKLTDLEFISHHHSNKALLDDKHSFTLANISSNISKSLIQSTTDYVSYIMLVEPQETHNRQGIEAYRQLCSNGLLYEYLEDEFKEKLGAEFKGRKQVKESVFQIYFTDNRYYGVPSALPKKTFSEILPPVYRLLSHFKERDKRNLPKLLQTMESTLILHIVCKRLHRERPKMLLLTVHDSIVTTKGNEAYVHDVMYEELTRYIGVHPTLKTEPWHPDNVKNLFRG